MKVISVIRLWYVGRLVQMHDYMNLTEDIFKKWQLHRTMFEDVELCCKYGVVYECNMLSIAPIYIKEDEESKNLVRIIYLSDVGDISFRISAEMLKHDDFIKEVVPHQITKQIGYQKKYLERLAKAATA